MATRRQQGSPPPAWYLRFGNLSQMASALVALVGFSAVVWQINQTSNKNTQEAYRAEVADARKVYMAYSDATLKYPELTDPDYDALMRNHTEYMRYQNFVSHMLYAYDEMLTLAPLVDSVDEDEWELAFQIDLEPHHRYICQLPDPRLVRTFHAAMQRRLNAARQNCGDTKPLVETTQTSAR
jgi:hypothetical protein